MTEESKEAQTGTEEVEENYASEGDGGSAEDLKAQLQEQGDRLLRLASDFDNFRRRARRDLEEEVNRQLGGVFTRLLPILDNLRRAVEVSVDEQSADALRTGVEMTLRQMEGFLAREGVEEIATQGTPFDPYRHEALMQEERSDVPDGQVLEALLRGYQFRGQVLRPAMVKVARGGPAGGAGEETGSRE